MRRSLLGLNTASLTTARRCVRFSRRFEDRAKSTLSGRDSMMIRPLHRDFQMIAQKDQGNGRSDHGASITAQFLLRPPGHLGDHGVFVFGKFLQRWHEILIAAVADRYDSIST